MAGIGCLGTSLLLFGGVAVRLELAAPVLAFILPAV